MRSLMVLGSSLALGLVAAHGCKYSEVDPLHCSNNDGDAYCAAQFSDGSRPYCELGAGDCISSASDLGCVAQQPADACYSPCGGRASLDENGECIPDESSSGSSSGGMETESSSGSESGSESSTTGPQPCVEDEECGAGSTPFCGPAGTCVACDEVVDSDAACAGLEEGTPACVEGTCVQCTAAVTVACTGTTPVCDEAMNTCVACMAHDQCGDAACNLYTGACLPGDAVVHVGPGQRFTNLTAAVGSFTEEGAEGTIVVHQANYDEAVTVDGGRVLAFLADEGATPAWALIGGGSPQLTVSDATVLMDGVRMSGNADDVGLVVNGGRVWVDRGRIVQNSGGGIVAQGGAELTLRNCFVGGDVSDIAALVVNGSSADILYTSAGAGFGTAAALVCDVAATVEVRNSLLVARSDGDEVMCDATFEHNAAELDLGGTNTALGTMNTNWFAGYGTGDFSLSAMHPPAIGTAALWTDGDPPTDINGDLRPTEDGASDYAGADVP